MKFINSKKADGVIAILIVIIILVFIGWLVNVGNRECRSDRDCGKESYCGSDFACHQIPVIEKSPVVIERHYTMPALILGIAIVVTAVIFNWDKLRSKKASEEIPSTESLNRLKAP